MNNTQQTSKLKWADKFISVPVVLIVFYGLYMRSVNKVIA
jgi:hypothetical protein